MAAPLPLAVLELREEAPQPVSHERSGVRVVRSMEHEHGGANAPERRRKDTLRLEPQHVGPSLLVRREVEGGALWIRLLVDGIDVVENPARRDAPQQPLRGICHCRVDPLEEFAELGAGALVDPASQLGACPLVEGTAADQSQRSDALRVLGSEGEREHRAPRLPDERGALTETLEQRGEILDVRLHGQRRATAPALPRFQHSKAARQPAREQRRAPRGGGPSVKDDDRRAVTRVVPTVQGLYPLVSSRRRRTLSGW